jgi:urease gamma subunit
MIIRICLQEKQKEAYCFNGELAEKESKGLKLNYPGSYCPYQQPIAGSGKDGKPTAELMQFAKLS